MRDVFRTVAALRSALSAHRDLLLEILALRHQLGVLARSDRRFRPSDRLLWGVLASVMAPVEGGSGAGPAGHGRPLVSRRISWVLEPSLATATGKATLRFTTASPHSANGHGEPSLGRSADPRRVVETRSHCLGTHGVAVSTRPTDGTVADLAYIPR
jgi:hypothetical protein